MISPSDSIIISGGVEDRGGSLLLTSNLKDSEDSDPEMLQAIEAAVEAIANNC